MVDGWVEGRLWLMKKSCEKTVVDERIVVGELEGYGQ